MGDNMVAALAIVLIFGTPIVVVLTHHWRKVLELKLKLRQGADQNVVDALQDLRQQMTDLRDTTTRYDLSFDAALQRLESRVTNVERQVAAADRPQQESVIGRG